jgi:hypothetical protein
MPDTGQAGQAGRTKDRSPPQALAAGAGRMTAAMRALGPASGPKVLRVGLVVGGRLLEERVVKRRTSVTVGPDEKATFVVEAGAPPGFKLFERTGDHYCLNVKDGMTGRVALATGFVDLASLAEQAHATRRSNGQAFALRLDESARGKVVVGGTTFLFQFVAPPPVSARPQLPLSVKDGLAGRIDWTLTILAAFSFLVHFGLVGAMYSDWTDTVVDEDVTAGLVDTLVRESEPPLSVPVETATGNEPKDAPSAAPVPVAPDKSTAGGKAKAAGETADAKAIAGLLSDVDRMSVALIGSLAGGPNVRGVMASGESGAPVDLDAIARRETRVERAGGGLDLPTGAGGPIAPPGRAFAFPTSETGGAPATAGRATTVVPNVEVREEVPALGGALPDAEAVIRSQIHPGAKRCYQRGLDADPSQSGKLVLVIKVGPSGEVESATTSSNTGLSAAVASCIAAVARRARFDRTGPNGATVVVPFGFVKQGG